MTSALIIKMPLTADGRRELLDAVKCGALSHECPDGSRIEDVDWDEVARSVNQYCTETKAESAMI